MSFGDGEEEVEVDDGEGGYEAVVVSKSEGSTTVKRKEAENITIPKFPSITSLKQWRLQGWKVLGLGGWSY